MFASLSPYTCLSPAWPLPQASDLTDLSGCTTCFSNNTVKCTSSSVLPTTLSASLSSTSLGVRTTNIQASSLFLLVPLTQSSTNFCPFCFSNVTGIPLCFPSALPLLVQGPITSHQTAAGFSTCSRCLLAHSSQNFPLTATRLFLVKCRWTMPSFWGKALSISL